MDTRGRKGAGSADMNRAAKTHLGCGRHGSRVHLTHTLHPRPLLSLKCVALWPLNTFPTLKMTMWWMWFVSSGYFIYDFFDMLLNQKLSQSWELLCHHVVVGLSYIFASDSVGDSEGLTLVNKCKTTLIHLSQMKARERQSILFTTQRTSESGTKRTNHSSLPLTPSHTPLPPSLPQLKTIKGSHPQNILTLSREAPMQTLL